MNGLWERISRLVVSRPVWVLVLALLLVVPPLLAVPSIRLSHDTLSELPPGTESAEGYRALSDHFAPGALSPVILVVDSETPVTEPTSFLALGDLSRNLKRLDSVASVRSAAMPTDGERPELEDDQAAVDVAAFGDRLQEAADGAGQLADGLQRVRDGLAEIDQRLPELAGGLDEAQDGVGQLLDGAGRLRDGIDRLRDGVAELRRGLREARDGAARLRDDVARPAEASIREAWDALNSFTVGTADPNYQRAAEATGETYGRLTGEHPVTGEQVEPGYEGLTASMDELANGLGEAVAGSARLDDGLAQLDDGVARLADGLQQLADGLEEAGPGVARLQDGIDRLLDGTEQLLGGARELRVGLASGAAKVTDSGITELVAASTGGTEGSGPFVVTPGLLDALPEVRDQLGVFLTQDSTRTRLFVGLAEQPFAPEALDSIGEIEELARLSLQGSPLADADVYATGTSAFFDDLDQAADADFTLIVIAVILGVFLVLVVLLRALVAPLYMVITVLLSFASALGITAIVFQGFLGHDGLAWWIPPFLYVLLVALGADYNIYLMSRVREEAEHTDTRSAVAEATRATGGVITSAGLILAGTFAAMMAAPMSSLQQMGFATTVGILLDTFVVRTFLVPSLAVLIGRHSWWPSKRARTA